MTRKDNHEPASDTSRTRMNAEHDAREHLLELGANSLEPRPWQPQPAPPSATDLAHFALWNSATLPEEGLLSALTLLPAVKAEANGIETGLLFAARAAGITWAQIADALGFNSPQACQQHFTRLTSRSGTTS